MRGGWTVYAGRSHRAAGTAAPQRCQGYSWTAAKWAHILLCPPSSTRRDRRLGGDSIWFAYLPRSSLRRRWFFAPRGALVRPGQGDALETQSRAFTSHGPRGRGFFSERLARRAEARFALPSSSSPKFKCSARGAIRAAKSGVSPYWSQPGMKLEKQCRRCFVGNRLDPISVLASGFTEMRLQVARLRPRPAKALQQILPHFICQHGRPHFLCCMPV